MNYFEMAKHKLAAWAKADVKRIFKLHDTLGFRDVATACDYFAYKPDVITWLARIMGATAEEQAQFNNFDQE